MLNPLLVHWLNAILWTERKNTVLPGTSDFAFKIIQCLTMLEIFSEEGKFFNDTRIP